MMQEMPEMGDMAESSDNAGGSTSKLISDIQAGMKKLGMLLEKSGVAGPDELQEYSDLITQFEDFVTEIASDKEEAPAKTAQAVSSPEAGGNPNARPM